MRELSLIEKDTLANMTVDKTWSFAEKTIKDTTYLTHGYYTYPAKFIPQLAARLINEFSNETDIVIDPFMGSETTVVEAILNKRVGIGTDINDIAYLLAKVKTTPIKPLFLMEEFNKIELDLQNRLNGQYDFFINRSLELLQKNERIDYWFLPEQKNKLTIIFTRILEIDNKDVRDFYLIAFAQILKTCSIWLQKSVKPTRDKNKKIYEPHSLFLNQLKKMIRKHYDFDKQLNVQIKEHIDNFRIVRCEDARNLPCDDGKASLIVTSPPNNLNLKYAA